MYVSVCTLFLNSFIPFSSFSMSANTIGTGKPITSFAALIRKVFLSAL